ncbi:MAG: DUF1553 domain-containing protein, partial [Verrucomicrobiae bacterium]|nr:DUF1553 domain-containing protein [Verrucomicrobiae bacterium]
PDLLDWLAVEFMQEGWSTKRLIRRLVLSQTFRQSGRVDQAAVDHDPDNRLWHHYPTRRLEAESIRDAMLAVSGRLDPTLFGRPIDPPRAKEDPAKRLFSGPLDGNGRRSIYLKMSIMDPPKFLVGFNLPDLKLPSGKRDETNVPTQALVLLNDPLVKELSRQWAKSLVAGSQAAPEDMVAQLFLAAYGRVPDSSETNRWVSAWQSFRANSADDLQAWSEITHLIFNTKEFLYVR